MQHAQWSRFENEVPTWATIAQMDNLRSQVSKRLYRRYYDRMSLNENSKTKNTGCFKIIRFL